MISMQKLCTVMVRRNVRKLHYVQGQSPNPKTREYFYYIDHQGQLFLDDARIKNFTSCFKEKKFLEFFFTRLQLNETGRYESEFPYFSPCGRERNYVNADDVPAVFTHVYNADSPNGADGANGSDAGSTEEWLSYCGAGDRLSVPFEPRKVCMLPETGRVYHAGPERLGGVGLIKSSLAIEMSKSFRFDNGELNPPTHFTWRGCEYELTNEVIPLLQAENERKKALGYVSKWLD